MRLGQRKNLARLLKPSEIAFIGGADAEVASRVLAACAKAPIDAEEV